MSLPQRCASGLIVGVLSVLAACGQAALLLDEGQCFDTPTGVTDLVRDVAVIDCEDPHDNEVYAVFDYAGDETDPDDPSVRDRVQEACIQRFEEFVGFDYRQSTLDLGFFWPDTEAWVAGDRVIQCFVYELDRSKVTGSLRDAGR